MIQEASDEIVVILAKKWGVNMQGPVPEVTAVLQRLATDFHVLEIEPGVLAAGPLPKLPVHGTYTEV